MRTTEYEAEVIHCLYARWFDTTPNNIRSLAAHFKKGDIKEPRVKFYRVDDLEEAPENED